MNIQITDSVQTDDLELCAVCGEWKSSTDFDNEGLYNLCLFADGDRVELDVENTV